jgi:hypothetical protein
MGIYLGSFVYDLYIWRRNALFGRELALYYFVIVCPLGFFGIKLHYLSKKKKNIYYYG